MFLAKDIRFEVLRLLKFLKVLVYKEDKTHITSYDPASMTLSLSHRFYSAVLAMIDSVRPSVTVWYHAKTTPATSMRSSLEDSPMTLVS